MWEDPIVAEVHRLRENLAAQYKFDINAFFADLQKRQAALGERLVLPRKGAEPTGEIEERRQADSANLKSSKRAPAA